MQNKRPTADDVARASGVSRSTVSFVLNDTPGQTISPVVRDRVQAEALRLGYVPHPHARALASGQSYLILVLLPDWPIEYLTRQVLDEAGALLDEAGYSLVTMESRRSGRAKPLWETLRPDVVLPLQSISAEEADAIRRSGARLATSERLSHPAFDIGPELQTQHLLSLGHRSIAYASTTVRGMQSMNDDRMARTRAAAALGSAEFTDGVVDDDARDLVGSWVTAGVTGVVAFNDETAARVVGAALRRGVAVPGALAVVGHDDSPLAKLIVPSLSTVSVDAAGLGRHLARRALAIAKGEPPPPADPLDIGARLVRREST